MISIEYRNVHPDREMTDEERQGAIRYFTALIERGENIDPKFARGDFTLGFAWWWESALMVRTADGECHTGHSAASIKSSMWWSSLGGETPPVVARLSQNCWLSNTSENHPVEVFNYGSEAFFR